MSLSPTAKLVAPHVQDVIKTAQDTIDASIAVRRNNQKAQANARKLLNEVILMVHSQQNLDKKMVVEKLQATLQQIKRMR